MQGALTNSRIPRPRALLAGFAMVSVALASIVVHPVMAFALLAALCASLWLFERPDFGPWLLLLLIPLEEIGPLDFRASKAVKLGIAIVVACGLLASGRKSVAPDPYRWPFRLLLLSGVLSSTLAATPLNSMLGLASITIFVFYYTALRGSGVLNNDGALLLNMVVGGALASTVLCYFQLTQGYTGVLAAAEHRGLAAEGLFSTVWPGISRTCAAFNGPSAAGAFFAAASIAALTHAVTIRGHRLQYLAAGLACWADLLSTFSRGALLGAVAGLGFAFWRLGVLRRRSLAAAACMLVGVLLFFGTEGIQQFLRVGGDVTSTSPERVDAWQAAKVLVRRNPVLGIGFYQFQSASRGIAGTADMAQHPHNGLLKTLVEQGPVGACAYVLFLWTFIRSSRKTALCAGTPDARWIFSAIAGAGVSFFTQELVDANFTVGGSSIAMLFASMLAVQAGGIPPSHLPADR